MKKTASILSIIAILLATNISVSSFAEAGYWTSTPQYGGSGPIYKNLPYIIERDGPMRLRFR